jgi:hypothetical protein
MRSDLGIAALDARMQCRELLARCQQQRAHRRWHALITAQAGQGLEQAVAGLRDRDAELGQQTAQAVDQRRALSKPARAQCRRSSLPTVGWRDRGCGAMHRDASLQRSYRPAACSKSAVIMVMKCGDPQCARCRTRSTVRRDKHAQRSTSGAGPARRPPRASRTQMAKTSAVDADGSNRP